MILSILSKEHNCFRVKGTELFVNLYCKQSYLAIRKDESPWIYSKRKLCKKYIERKK